MRNPLGSLFDLVSGFVPVDTQSAANPGTYVSLKNYEGVVFVFHKAIGVANDDPVLELQQAVSVAGGSAKDLTAFKTIYRKQGALVGAVGTWTKDTQTADEDYTMNATSAEQQALVAVYVDAADLDRDNGFDCVQCNCKDTGAAGAQLASMLYILVGPRYQRSPEDSLSAIAD